MKTAAQALLRIAGHGGVDVSPVDEAVSQYSTNQRLMPAAQRLLAMS